mgnify:FL=1
MHVLVYDGVPIPLWVDSVVFRTIDVSRVDFENPYDPYLGVEHELRFEGPIDTFERLDSPMDVLTDRELYTDYASWNYELCVFTEGTSCASASLTSMTVTVVPAPASLGLLFTAIPVLGRFRRGD